jgi:methyltransferase (TIGR00027 family)
VSGPSTSLIKPSGKYSKASSSPIGAIGTTDTIDTITIGTEAARDPWSATAGVHPGGRRRPRELTVDRPSHCTPGAPPGLRGPLALESSGSKLTAMAEPLIQHISDTAFLVAQYRALESARPDPLFRDAFAERLAGEKGKAIVASFSTPAMAGWHVAIRTVVIDELIREAVARGVGMVINLGAGLDARPYRLDLPPDLVWIEVDYPDVIRFKGERLSGEAPRFGMERVELDLADVGARRRLFAELDARGRRALVLTEGVVPYLTNDQVAALADDLRALTIVDGWIVDYFSPQVHAWRDRHDKRHQDMKAAPFKFRPRDWFAFFESHGWHSREVRYLADEGARRNRQPPLPRLILWMVKLLGPFVSAARRDGFRRSLAYVLLEPKSRTA